MIDLKKLITIQRCRKSTSKIQDIYTAIQSDRSRILYSAPFRRLQQKAQVFSLESNSAVRSRLSHSLEVADVGMMICTTAFDIINKNNTPTYDESLIQNSFTKTVECACLLHDIGNPPFGHLGEAAIRTWFSEKFDNNAAWTKSLKSAHKNDFLEFDGNPQGLRIITHLMTEVDQYGLNLTYSTILSTLKYSRVTCNQKNKNKSDSKKAGYFHSEFKLINEARKSLSMKKSQRHLASHIMEVADDISYCLSDIEDGIEKGIISIVGFFDNIKHAIFLNDKDNIINNKDFLKFKINFAVTSRIEAAKNLATYLDSNQENNTPNLLPKDGETYKNLELIKSFAKKFLYRSESAENPELAGFSIIYGLLDKFEKLLHLDKEIFKSLIDAKFDLQKLPKNQDYEFRLTNKLSDKYVSAYKNALDSDGKNEMFHRAHLIVDHISGMTDSYALELFQILEGIKINAKY